MALSKEKFHLRTEHSKLLGYWTVELGGLNQVSECYLSHQLVSALNIELKRGRKVEVDKVKESAHQVTHLWEYDSYSHRAGVRAKLGGHQQWQVGPFLNSAWLIHRGCQGRVLPKDPALAPTPGQHGIEKVSGLQVLPFFPVSCPLPPWLILVRPGNFGSWRFQEAAIGRGSLWKLPRNWKRRWKASSWADSSPPSLVQSRLHFNIINRSTKFCNILEISYSLLTNSHFLLQYFEPP